ncbi:MAG: ATP-binding protein [Aureliella sp.]
MLFRWNKTLKTKIFLTCGVLICICVCSALSGWGAQSYLLENFANYERTEKTGVAIADIDRRVQRLQAHSQRYVDTGATSRLTAALELQQELVQDIATVEVENADTALADLLYEMEASLSSFGGQLRLAAEERGLRTQLVSVDLPAEGLDVRELIEQLHTQLASHGTTKLSQAKADNRDGEIDGEPSSSDAIAPPIDPGRVIRSQSKLHECLQAFASAEQSLSRYLIDNNAADFSASINSLQTSKTAAQSLDLDGLPKAATELQSALNRELKEYQRLGTRAFQATRGYLYYSDVVLAGELSEFAYLANRLQEYVTDSRLKSRSARDAASATARLVSVVTCFASIVLGVLFSTRLTQIISAPISQLTKTFNHLSTGESVKEIPAIKRDDEIGRMARAAQVFSEKNQETRMLLQRTSKLSEELKAKANELQEINQELDNFAYVASHDLRSPLRGINHLAHWVREDCEGLLPESAQTHLDKMQERVSKMDALLNDLLEYSRAGRIRPTPELVDISAEVQSIVEMIEILPEGFSINVQPGLPIVSTVRTPLHQVLLNLVSNAVKYNEKGGEGLVDVRMQLKNGWCHFEVEDNGPGIEPEFHSKIFEMYQRVSLTTEGTGMGLAISKKQVEAYGGEIAVESAGSGATFKFTWPVLDATSQPPTSDVHAASEH